MNKDLIFDSITAITAIINIFLVYYVFKLTRQDLNPKLYVESFIEKDYEKAKDFDFTTEARLYDQLSLDDFRKKGFPEETHSNYTWILTIKNNGDLPATKVEIDYCITIQKAEIETGIDESDIKNVKFIDYKTVSDKQKYDYIPPNGEIKINLLDLHGRYPYAYLKIAKLKSKERTFINNQILLKKYAHSGWDNVADSYDYRKMLGVHWDN
ncbi:hypothetical protein F3K44_32835 [Bacillus megaterium]|nr:hypothetical protein [Priestia megaterium]